MSKKKKISYLPDEDEISSQASENISKKLREKLKECQKEKEEYLTQAQRARADLINYRRRQEELVSQLRKYGQVELIRELLPALESLQIGSEKNKDFKTIKDQLENILKKYGLEKIKSVGEKFDPNFHEAIEQVESKEKEGIIIEEVQKGYLLIDKVLRPSKVKVSK